MANTFTQLYIQVVFTVKGRENVIKNTWKEELYKYICGIVKNKKQKLYIINGMPDHIHILLGINPDISISELMKTIKSNSSKFINEKKFVSGKFQWQEGYGAFSYGQSQLPILINYIKNQEEHHKKKTFKEEYIEFLRKFEIEYNEKYLFDFLD